MKSEQPPRPEQPLRRALAASLTLFCALAAYSLQKPLRDAILAGRPGEAAQLFSATFVATLLLQPLWAHAASRFSRRELLAFLLGGLAFLCLALGASFSLFGAAQAIRPWLERTHFVGVSVANLLVVSVIWASVSEETELDSARRHFGPLAAGASLGALAGTAIVTGLGEGATPLSLLLWSAALLLVALLCLQGLGVTRARGPVPLSAWKGLGLLLKRPRLAGAAAYVVLFTFGSTWLYLFTTSAVGDALAHEGERIAFFAKLGTATSALTLAGQLLLARPALMRRGVGDTLAILPLVSACSLLALAFASGLGVLFAVNVLMAGARYALARPAREALLAGAPPADLFQAKAALDSAVYRGGDLLAGLCFGALVTGGVPLALVLLLMVPFQLAGVPLGRWLGRLKD